MMLLAKAQSPWGLSQVSYDMINPSLVQASRHRRPQIGSNQSSVHARAPSYCPSRQSALLFDEGFSRAFPGLGARWSLLTSIDALNAYRKNAISEISSLAERTLHSEITHSSYVCASACKYDSERYKVLSKKLISAPFWPFSLIQKRSLLCLNEALNTFDENWHGYDFQCKPSPGYNRCKGFRDVNPGYTIILPLKQLAYKVETDVIRLCLECVKAGHVQKEGGCEERHTALVRREDE